MAHHRYAFIACLVGLVVPACTQDQDEACQVNSDCDDGLVCSIGSSLRGTCVPPDEVPDDEMSDDGDAGDATVDEDVSVRDGAVDDDAG